MIPELKLNDPCGRLHCGPGWSRTRGNSLSLRDLELWLVWKGSGWMRTQERELVLEPGFCALMRPGGIYDAGHDEGNPLGITFIHFECKSPGKSWRQWPEFFGLQEVEYLDAVTRRIVELCSSSPMVGAQLLQALLADLLQKHGMQQQGVHRERILQMMDAVHSAEHLPTVALMAGELHMSQAHFSRVFRRVAGQSPMDFLLQVRLTRARHLLRETNLSMSEIAERLGYADVFFFSRQFKQKNGVPPLAYRNQG